MRQPDFEFFSKDEENSRFSGLKESFRNAWRWIHNNERRDRRQFWYKVYLIVFGIAFISLFLIANYVIRYNTIINRHLESHKWALPSTIYADAPVLSAGTPVDETWVLQYLRRLNYIKSDRPILKPGQYSIEKNTISFRRNLDTLDAANDFPLEIQFAKHRVQSLINTNTKAELPSYELEPVPISNLFGGQWEKRLLVRLRDVPAYLPSAILAIEDRRFYNHMGIDPIGIGRALWNDFRGKKRLQGASTITQQLVKNFYLNSQRTIKRKSSEALMALIMERKITKNEILELYLNEIYLGQRGSMSINGVGAASQLFFHKHVRFISLPEAALLAGMIQAPSVYDPYRHPVEAKKRRNLVLYVMKELGNITPEQYQRFSAEAIKVYPIDTTVNLAPYFGDLVEKQLLAKYNPEKIYTENFRIYTTIDLGMQQMAEDALTRGLKNIDKIRFKRVKKEAQGCLIAIEPKTGYVRAFVGGRNYTKSQFDRIHQASRQPGSLFKPLVYATALESVYHNSAQFFTPASLITDEPTVFQIGKKTWAPKNYDNQFHGTVTLRQALAYSMNVATAKLAQEVGLNQIVDLAHQLGIQTVKQYPSLALGTFEASPWQLIEAYTVFANGGVKSELRTVKKVNDIDGKSLGAAERKATQVLHPEVAYLITDMLKTVMTSGTAASSQRRGFTRPAAGKTGTTDDYRDAWFVGYTPNLICLVWTGYDDNTPVRMNGAEAALPIWVDFMKNATANLPETDFTPPPNVVAVDIDADTGKLASEICYNVRTELFIKGTEPVEHCTEEDHARLQNLYTIDQSIPVEGTPSVYYNNGIEVQPSMQIEQPQPAEQIPPEPEPQEDQPIYFAPPQTEESGAQTEPYDPSEQLTDQEDQTQDSDSQPPH